jgi:hypothetical protein
MRRLYGHHRTLPVEPAADALPDLIRVGGYLHRLDSSVRPAQLQVVQHGSAAVVVEAHLDFRQAELDELLGGLLVRPVRFSAGPSVWIIGADQALLASDYNKGRCTTSPPPTPPSSLGGVQVLAASERGSRERRAAFPSLACQQFALIIEASSAHADPPVNRQWAWRVDLRCGGVPDIAG